MSSGRFQRGCLYVAIVLSGFASLGYQIIWSKQLSAAIGLEGPAILAMITAFMGGFAIGAFCLDARIRKSATPHIWLMRLEATIASWGILSLFIGPWLPKLVDTFSDQAGIRDGITFVACLVLFAPSTIAMGATLPAMERTWTLIARPQSQIGLIYALNTLGATLGVLGTTFVLIPICGIQFALVGISSLSGVIALMIRFVLKTQPRQQAPLESIFRHGRELTAILPPLFWIGFLGMGLQILSTRVLSHFLDNTVFSYACILAVYLCGTALGAYWFHRRSEHNKTRESTPWFPLLLTGGMILLSLYLIPAWPYLWSQILPWGQGSAFRRVIVELFFAILLLLGPTMGSGFLFSTYFHSLRKKGYSIGVPLGWNLVGATLAPFLFYHLVPVFGTRNLLLAVALGYAVLSRPPTRPLPAACIILVLALTVLAPSSKTILGLPHDEKISYTEAPAGTISLHTSADGNKRLEVNNHFMMGGTEAAIAERRQAHLPLLLHPSPQAALFLGVGTGITLGAATHYPGLQSDAVELVPEIIEALPSFAEWNGFPYPTPQVRLHAFDARRFVRTTAKRYDLIVADVFHPAREGASLLYTKEHFQQIKSRLKPGGLFCQWLPLHQLDADSVRCLQRTFETVFADASVWMLDTQISLPVIAFVGGSRQAPSLEKRLERIPVTSALFRELKEVRLHQANRIASHFLTDFNQLDWKTESTPINTDDRQFLSYYMPHRKTDAPSSSILALFNPGMLEMNAAMASSPRLPPWGQHWEPLFRARDRYLRGQLAENQDDLNTAIAHYLSGIRNTPEFTLNYARCIQIATLFAQEKPHFSIQILESLVKLHPTEILTKKILDRIQE